MNLALLKKEAQETAKRLEDRLAKAIDENRDLTEEEEAADKADTEKLDRLAKQIEKAESLATRLSGISFDAKEEADGGSKVTVPAAPKANKSGFRNLAEFANAVRLANPAAGQGFKIDERLAAPSQVVTETGGDAAGSYLVPAEFRNEIIKLVYEYDDPIMNLITQRTTSSNRVAMIGNNWTPWGNAGVQAYWRVEAQQMTPTKPNLTPLEVKLNELYVFCNATEELLEDAPAISQMLSMDAAAAIRYKAADAFMYGDGIEKPLGFLNSGNGSLITVSKEGSQAADSLLPANVAKMYARMINPGRAVWLANSDIMPAIMSFESANGQMLWQSNYRDAPGGTLLGRPIYFTEHSKTVGDAGDLVLFNPDGYVAYRKQNGITFADSIHLYFDYNIRSFRWIFRIGGMPLLNEPVTPDNGSNTKSYVVQLAERA